MEAKSELKRMFTEHWNYFAVVSACELQVFDRIYKGQNTLEKLLNENNWNVKSFGFLLDYLLSENYVSVDENHYLALTEKGDLLREENENGLYYACLNWSGEHLEAWKNMTFSIQTGLSSFENSYHKPYFDFLNDDKVKLRDYHKAMNQYALDDYKDLPTIIDFSIHENVMDVGGSLGAVIKLIKQSYPDLKCFLFDLESVLEFVSFTDIVKIQGDFFKEIPKFSDAIILARVLHDWEDVKAHSILSNCMKALPEHGTLYIIENCTDKINDKLSLLSLNMTVMCKSFERTSKEYIFLCEAVGFKFIESKKLNELQTILILKK
jgi:C-methyltransferase